MELVDLVVVRTNPSNVTLLEHDVGFQLDAELLVELGEVRNALILPWSTLITA